MRIIQAQVSYGRKFPTGRYRMENVGVSLRVEFDSHLEDSMREIYAAYEKAKEIVEVQARMLKDAAEAGLGD
ncbi:MAG: hypothetical protein HW389_767 [Bacteroidetes bacterium]|nr:hypothetical protein [Bacteroidota bacterium]